MSLSTSPLKSAASKAGGTAQPSKLDAIEQRRVQAEARMSEYVQRIVSKAPPISSATRDRIAALVRAGA
ncbi:hypothetical protein RER_18930 [Rhodococcus erythropolis PR4]|uniref:Uncharacterized protein n=1 Tax=Rhodococcus erythropolis (strain PR4 / NBRC 100887) TaxID=234621 RepID=C0ZW66_RHOE4|nr:hypothetical protein RER_18930 [Rhodococcus erythropolis PR4]